MNQAGSGTTSREATTETIEYAIVDGQPQLGRSVQAQQRGVRRAGELERVTTAAVPPELRSRVQYWTFAGVANTRDRERLSALPLSYDLTFIGERPLGRERSKTHGHRHLPSRGQSLGLPEVYEVLEGEAGFLIQDLGPGPSATVAALVEARAGDRVVIPPSFHHISVNLGTAMLVVADLVSRNVEEDYAQLEAARGMAYSLAGDGRAIVNSAYARVPPLLRIHAAEPGTDSNSLYADFVAGADFGWLIDLEAFRVRFPGLWRLTTAASREAGASALAKADWQ